MELQTLGGLHMGLVPYTYAWVLGTYTWGLVTRTVGRFTEAPSPHSHPCTDQLEAVYDYDEERNGFFWLIARSSRSHEL